VLGEQADKSQNAADSVFMMGLIRIDRCESEVELTG